MLNKETEPVIFSAPSNIAIIKYMGKTSADQNLPTNASISYTLNHLRSYVTVEAVNGLSDYWEPLQGQSFLPIDLSDKGKHKFLNHLQRIKDLWKVETKFCVRSANNFPSDCGIASSSSSFAALTIAAVSVCDKLKPTRNPPDKSLLSSISRQGSGSSCRSFFEPWAIWQSFAAQSWRGQFQQLHHTVMLLDSNKKEVSSSEAHLKVTTSPDFSSRLINVKNRLQQIEKANDQGDWSYFCDLAFEEFEEMHALFETSVPSFSYRNSQTRDVLKQLQEMNNKSDAKILITMDAGNNIHCLSLPKHRDKLEKLENEFSNFKFINSWSGISG